MIITVFALKGGVGKTFIATNLAWALGGMGKTALLELDYQESVPAFFGIHPVSYLADALTDPKKLRDAMSVVDNITVIPGGPGLFKLEFEAGEKVLGNFNSLLTALGKHFDYIVVDTHNNPGLLTEAVLEHSTAVVVPARPGVLNEVSMKLTLNLLEKVRMVNRDLIVVGVVNALRKNVKVHEAFLKFAEGSGMFVDGYLPFSTAVEKSEVLKKPVTELDPRFQAVFTSLFTRLDIQSKVNVNNAVEVEA